MVRGFTTLSVNLTRWRSHDPDFKWSATFMLEQPLPPGFSCVQLEIETASAWVVGVLIPGSTARNP
eukprot:3291885-Amphidinium_carterae.1